MKAADVIAGRARASVEQADCLAWLACLPADSLDLCVFSPPYARARLYLEGGEDLGIARDSETWAAWMVEVFRQCVRVCKGLVACVCDDQTEGYRYGGGPLLLAADLIRAGFNLRRPLIYRRSGIPGSGGPDWFRCDHELIVCCTRPGRLPWSDTTACGHPPRWAPGGEMSHRLTNGQRVNQWGTFRRESGTANADPAKPKNGKPRPSHRRATPSATDAPPEVDLFGEPVPEGAENANDPYAGRIGGATNKRFRGKGGARCGNPEGRRKSHTKAKANGTDEQQSYAPPVLANPGTVIDCVVGGGQMGEGDHFSRENEAPFPEELAERFVLSFCPPNGVCCDPFSGSGTVAAVAVRHRRRFVGCDLRASQVALALQRLSTETPLALFAEEP